MIILVPLSVVILGRDLGLLLSGFFVRYHSLPPPVTLSKYFDISFPSTEVKPSAVSKINTVLQIVLLGGTLSSSVLGLPYDSLPLQTMHWLVAGTTIWSGLAYIKHHREYVKYLLNDRHKLG
jgi:cardiolipin synthase